MGKQTMRMVKPKLHASDITDRSQIYAYIKETYEDVPDKQCLKFLPSFILFVCCVIEEVYSKKTKHVSKINKREEVLYHICLFFAHHVGELTDDDKLVISNIIEDLHSSNRIKKISIVQKMIFHIGNWFLKSH